MSENLLSAKIQHTHYIDATLKSLKIIINYIHINYKRMYRCNDIEQSREIMSCLFLMN